jgi:hypothetical protein
VIKLRGAAAGGFIGTLVLTSALRGASEAGLTRMDLPFLLGTAMSRDRGRAKAVGYLLHFAFGEVFALTYYATFKAIGRSGWGLGAALGAVHGTFSATALVNILLPIVHPRMGSTVSAADSAPLIEPPGFLMLNYGGRTPLVSLAAHMAYGAIVGGFTAHTDDRSPLFAPGRRRAARIPRRATEARRVRSWLGAHATTGRPRRKVLVWIAT